MTKPNTRQEGEFVVVPRDEGRRPAGAGHACPFCNGTGWHRPIIARPAYDEATEAQVCREEAAMLSVRCNQCSGTGSVTCEVFAQMKGYTLLSAAPTANGDGRREEVGAHAGAGGDPWHEIESAPRGVWLETRREGERGSNVTFWRGEADCAIEDREWIDREGRTTVTHGTFLPPTHWRFLGFAAWDQLRRERRTLPLAPSPTASVPQPTEDGVGADARGFAAGIDAAAKWHERWARLGSDHYDFHVNAARQIRALSPTPVSAGKGAEEETV